MNYKEILKVVFEVLGKLIIIFEGARGIITQLVTKVRIKK